MKTQVSTWHTISPLVVALFAAAAAYAVHRLFIGTSLGQTIDTAALQGGDIDHPRVSEVLGRTLNGTRLVVLAGVCLLAAAFGALRRRMDLALAAGFLVVAANVATQQLKAGLERPLLDGVPMPNSWPSGHATAAASAAFVLVLVFPRAMRGMVGLAGAGYVAIVSVATVWAEWHRPSDAIAALFIVLACGSLALFGVRLARRGGPSRSLQLPNRLVMICLGIAAALSVAGAVFGMASVAVSERALPELVSDRFAFLTGTAGILAATAVTFIVWVRLTAAEPAPAPPAPAPARTRPAVPARSSTKSSVKTSAKPATKPSAEQGAKS
ncbi:phosphatase PAP2 family protein [Actinoplanes couchii]|uniref:phosphatase PAP2 family protein n=1 Tax=Actinoplanes couchii TaxID=403638 RepID=UPI001EF32A5E|nr:phosphatase PAP2 family protein [Actinoplanes couchii]MDR6316462.1 membrane-associated phospholipid phosphatase [Actinoplanes couchii]